MKHGFGNWLFNKFGNASRPWPTAKQLWSDPEVQKIIQRHNKIVSKKFNYSEKPNGLI